MQQMLIPLLLFSKIFPSSALGGWLSSMVQNTIRMVNNAGLQRPTDDEKAKKIFNFSKLLIAKEGKEKYIREFL